MGHFPRATSNRRFVIVAMNYFIEFDLLPEYPPTRGKPKSALLPVTFCSIGVRYCGHFPQAIGKRRFVIVVMNYFTKWLEAETLANIQDVDVKKSF